MRSIIHAVAGIVFVVGLLASAQLAAQAVNITGEWAFTVQTDQGGGTPAITFKLAKLIAVNGYIQRIPLANIPVRCPMYQWGEDKKQCGNNQQYGHNPENHHGLCSSPA